MKCVEDKLMKKVGIMSMQRIANYGSFLQAYGLKCILEELGCEVQFVDYHIDKPLISDKKNDTSKIIRKIKKVLESFKFDASLRQKFQFIKYKKDFGKKYFPILGITEKENYNPTLDLLVIGSDEVFNCIQTNTNVGYSLELFGLNNNAKKLISYAGSFGNTTLKKLYKFNKAEEIGCLLAKFDAISVRDANSGSIVSKLTNLSPYYHLDPVLTYDYFNKCDLIPEIITTEKYLILYAYSGRITSDEANWIKAYAKRKNLKIYAFGGIHKCADKFISCSPFEVLSYFKQAEEVITDTFHGSIFSIISEKPFTTLVRKSIGNNYGNEEKLTDLLSRLGLSNRCTTKIEDVQIINSKLIDYAPILDELMKQRKRTIDYLFNFIK